MKNKTKGTSYLLIKFSLEKVDAAFWKKILKGAGLSREDSIWARARHLRVIVLVHLNFYNKIS